MTGANPNRRRFKRKRGLRRTSRRKRRLRLNTNPMRTAFPANRIVKMKYVSKFVIDVGASAEFKEYIFSANSIFDPDVTSAGHQPYGFDQWTTFYKQYVVLGSKITVQGITDTTSTPSIYGVRTVDLATTGHTTITGLMENPIVSYRVLQLAANGNVPDPATARFSAKKWFNVKDVKDNKTRIGALMTASPSEQAYFSVFAGPHNATTDIPAIYFLATIHYTVLLSEPKELPQS